MSFLRQAATAAFHRLFKMRPGRFYGLGEAWRAASAYPVKAGDNGGEVVLYPLSDRELHRLRRLLTKEPDTIAWIDGFGTAPILLDVGANIGVYSIYTLLRHQKATVVSVEPEPENYLRLLDNLNRTAPARATAYCLGLSDAGGLAHLDRDAPGTIGSNNNQIVREGHGIVGVASMTIDDLVGQMPDRFPTHIKIDVDGIELAILAGAERTLADPRLRSILIEAQDPAMARRFDEILAAAGWPVPDVPATKGNRIYTR